MLHSICQQIWKTQEWPQDWKRSVFIPIPKKGNAKECSNYRTIALISQTSKVMLKILQTQASIVRELRISRCSCWISKRQRNQRSNCQHLLDHKKTRELQKTIYFCFIDNVKAFDCVDHNKQWKILKEMGFPDYLICLLRNLYTGQKLQLEPDMEQRTGSRLGKEYIKSPCLFNLYAEYIM